MNAAVGPLSTSPPTIGLTATTGARLATERLAQLVDRQDRSDRDDRVGGADHDRVRRPAIARSTSGVVPASRAPRNCTSCTSPCPRAWIRNSCSPDQRPSASTRVRTGRSLIGSTARADAESAPLSSRCASVRRRPCASACARLIADGQILVAEVEPDLVAELAQRVHHREAVALEAPAARVDAVGQPEADEVGVGGDVPAVDLDVVAGVGDHRQALGPDDVEHAPRQLRAPGSPGQDDHRPSVGQEPKV